jgi:hypothetical protein
MLTKKTPEELASTLTVKGQGQSVTFDITFYFRTQKEMREQADAGKSIADLVVFVVKSWDTEYDLTTDGVEEMEDARPGIALAILEGFHASRRVEREKN